VGHRGPPYPALKCPDCWVTLFGFDSSGNVLVKNHADTCPTRTANRTLVLPSQGEEECCRWCGLERARHIVYGRKMPEELGRTQLQEGETLACPEAIVHEYEVAQ